VCVHVCVCVCACVRKLHLIIRRRTHNPTPILTIHQPPTPTSQAQGFRWRLNRTKRACIILPTVASIHSNPPSPPPSPPHPLLASECDGGHRLRHRGRGRAVCVYVCVCVCVCRCVRDNVDGARMSLQECLPGVGAVAVARGRGRGRGGRRGGVCRVRGAVAGVAWGVCALLRRQLRRRRQLLLLLLSRRVHLTPDVTHSWCGHSWCRHSWCGGAGSGSSTACYRLASKVARGGSGSGGRRRRRNLWALNVCLSIC
jgi:hypothetical protein